MFYIRREERSGEDRALSQNVKQSFLARVTQVLQVSRKSLELCKKIYTPTYDCMHRIALRQSRRRRLSSN